MKTGAVFRHGRTRTVSDAEVRYCRRKGPRVRQHCGCVGQQCRLLTRPASTLRSKRSFCCTCIACAVDLSLHVQMAGRKQCNDAIVKILAVALPIGLTYFLYSSEKYFFDQQVAFDAVEPLVVDVPDPARPLSSVTEDALVHVAAESFTSTVTDSDFGLTVDGGVSLHRNTEYCKSCSTAHLLLVLCCF